ncbi:MAG: transcription-repair coupling factor, partial [Pseudobdellovibrio sp.]|nr:transcription-repair coupling factor [Pseudobdellovibrio sp.]
MPPDNKPAPQHISTRIESLIERGFEKHKNIFHIVGASSSFSSAFLLSNNLSKHIHELPRLVVTSSLESALQFRQELEFFTPEFRCHLLQSYDVSPFSGLFPSPEVRNSRVNFLYWAANAHKSDIFIAPVSALMQLSVPYNSFSKRCKKLQAGDELVDDVAGYLNSLGYQSAPVVEDVGQYSLRGGIVDIYSPAEKHPVRIELFGDQIESLRYFSVTDQRSLEEIKIFNLTPVQEFELTDENIESVIKDLRKEFAEREVTPTEADEIIRSISLKNYFTGCELLLPYVEKDQHSPLDHFSSGLNVFILDVAEVSRAADEWWQELESDRRSNISNASVTFCPPLSSVAEKYESLKWPDESRIFNFSNLSFLEESSGTEERISYSSLPLTEFSLLSQNMTPASEAWLKAAKPKLDAWISSGNKIFIASKNSTQNDRLKSLLNKLELSFDSADAESYDWQNWAENKNTITLIPRPLPATCYLTDEKIIFLRSEDFFGKKQRTATQNAYEQFSSKAKSLAFGDLKPNDLVVHVKHGIGVYEGLKIMNIGGAESEYIQVGYKDKDKLYLPVYRVGQLQKFSGAGQTSLLDKLGGTGWEKTKIKVKSHLRDIAAELLQLYAKRSELHRPPLEFDEIHSNQFEKGFPYDETQDQLKAIDDIHKDFGSTKPMDRLVCGDVGFGKTEVAMRAAFQAVENKKQVAVLAPTTVLTFQHLETFKKRFQGWNLEIHSLNRFVSTADQKKTLAALREGKVDILIGTHRLLSKDVVFKDLGLLIIDEEQKFGVVHKEKIKKLKTDVDTLTLSATPIPRTLNMSFTGMRDLSIINTAPVDRLPTRTFISKFDSELIRKAIQSEVSRGGQVYFIHNRVQSIYGVADELKQILPDVRMKVAHGQMNEEELESAMLAFFHHEIDVLVCTAIVESGMDVPKANTMFIDQAHMFGLSQLYQLRGRVGRSKARAFCYLLLPKDKKIDKDAQERLKIIQDNSALGSGIRIAQYDLELRGAGNILGDDQSGHVNAVGYELYMDLLNEALSEAKGESLPDRELDPEINLRVPALIPDSYIADIRIRLSYYKALSEIASNEEMNRIEDELKDQFGPLPDPVINLMGLML